LCVATVTEVGPEAVERPCVGGEKLAFRFAAGVCVPELSAQNETTECLDAAGVDFGRILRWAREERFL